MKNETLSGLLNGYESTTPEGGERFYCRSISGSPVVKRRGRLSRLVKSVIERFTDIISYSSTRAFGMFFVGFGLLSLLLHFTNDYFSNDEVLLYVLLSCTLISILGVVFLVFDKPIAIAFQEFAPTDFIFFEFFCIKRMPRKEDAPRLSPIFGLVFGMLLAVLGILIPFQSVILCLVAIISITVTMMSTEFGYFVTFLALPYLDYIHHSDIVLAVLVAVTFLSFIRKVVMGKRVYSFEQYDLVIALFALFVLISGVFVKGLESFSSSVFLCLMACGYPLSSSLITNRRLADCMMNAIIVSSIPATVIAISQGIAGLTRGVFGGVSGSFSSPNELALFLLVSSIFTLYYIRVNKSAWVKALYAVFFLLSFVALVFVGDLWVFITGLFALLAYGATKLQRFSGIATVGICAAPSLLVFLPASFLTSISRIPVISLLELDEYAVRWQSSLRMLLDNIFVGIGIGPDCFREEIGSYDIGADYRDSGSFFLEIGVEAGIFALLAFLILFLIRLRHRSSYTRFLKRSQVRLLSRFSAVALVALIVFGSFDYIWSDPSAIYLFWCVFGASSASLRVSRQNYDDYVGYYSDGRSDDSSAVDVEIG